MGYVSRTEAEWRDIRRIHNVRKVKKRNKDYEKEAKELGITIGELKHKKLEEIMGKISIFLNQYKGINEAGVYIIKNKITNKIYIGQTTNFYRRWYEHTKNLFLLYHHNENLQFEFNKYGIDVFEFKVAKEIIGTQKEREIEELSYMFAMHKLKLPMYNVIRDTEIIKYKTILELNKSKINYVYEYKTWASDKFTFIIYKNKDYQHVDFHSDIQLEKLKENILYILFVKSQETVTYINNAILMCKRQKIPYYILYMEGDKILNKKYNY